MPGCDPAQVSRLWLGIWFAGFLCLMPCCLQAGDWPQLKDDEARRIAEQIFDNECAGQIRCLTSWNEGEEFASLGIGHFIWYPAGEAQRFEESFPRLRDFLMRQGVELPAWLRQARHCPWPDRQSFLRGENSEKMRQLRRILQQNFDLQARFMVQRMQGALARIEQAADPETAAHVRRQFLRLASSPMGYYPLVDYVNFKGEGTSPRERYQGVGWGLMQVLGEMSGDAVGLEAIAGFAAAAGRVLRRRVALSPPERNERRWLPGWLARLKTYVRVAEPYDGLR